MNSVLDDPSSSRHSRRATRYVPIWIAVDRVSVQRGMERHAADGLRLRVDLVRERLPAEIRHRVARRLIALRVDVATHQLARTVRVRLNSLRSKVVRKAGASLLAANCML